MRLQVAAFFFFLRVKARRHRSTHRENLRYKERELEQYPNVETEYLETIC
jgi:hypothetical protein